MLTDSRVLVNAVNLSAFMLSHDLPQNVEAQDATAFTKTTREFKPGLRVHTLTLEFFQDFAAGGPDATLSALIGAAAFAINLRTSSAAISATNPEYQGQYILENYNPMSGRIGEMQKCSATFRPAGPLTRATV